MWTFDAALANAKKKIKQEKYKDALYILRQLERIDPNDMIIQMYIGFIYIEDEKTYDEGISIIEDVLNSDKRNIALFEMAKKYKRIGYRIKAREYLLKIIESDNLEYKNRALLELGRLEYEEGNKEDAINYFDQINDDYALIEKGKINMFENNFVGAHTLLKYVYNNTKDYIIKQYASTQLIYLYIRQGNYKKAFDLFSNIKNYEEFDIYDDYRVDQYLQFKLGLIDCDSYTYKQIKNYNEKETKKHIKKHLKEKPTNFKHTMYNKDINIDILYEDVKLKIANKFPYIVGVVDKYIIDYDYTVGNIDGIDTDRIEVVTLPNTKQIITMYPIPNIKDDSKVKIIKKI